MPYKRIYYSILSMLFLFFIVFLVFSDAKNLPAINQLKQTYPVSFTLITYFLLSIPFFLLFTQKDFREDLSTGKKSLIISLSLLLAASMLTNRLAINIGALFFLCVLIFAVRERKFHTPDWRFILFGLYFLIHAISLLWVDNLSLGLNYLRIYLPFITFPVAFSFFRLTRHELELILYTFFRFLFIFILLSVASWMYESLRLGIPLNSWFIFHKTPFAGLPPYFIVYSWSDYWHPTFNSIGYMFAFAIGLFLYDSRKTSTKIHIVEFGIFAVLTFLVNMLVQSRTGLVNLILFAGLGVIWLLRKRKQLLKYYVGVCIAGGLLVSIFFHSHISGFISDNAREQLHKTAFSSIENKPILGTGIGGMRKIIDSDELAHQLGYAGALKDLGNPHNQFIGDMMQTGIMGLLLICLILVSFFYAGVAKRNWLLLAYMIIFSLVMLIEMPLSLLKGVTLFVPFICLLMQLNVSKGTYLRNK